MATEIPSDITLKTLKGSWTLDKSISDDADPILKLQGVGWLTRKAIGAATLTLHFTSTTTTTGPSPSTETEKTPGTPTGTVHLTMRQTLTGGIPGATEERIMDWVERERSNPIYGDTMSRSRFIGGVRGDDGRVRADLAMQSQSKGMSVEAEGEIREFLCGGTPWIPSPQEKDGGEDGYGELFVHDFGRSERGGWVAEQVWSLEVIDSQTYLTRRVVVVKGDVYEKARLVYRFNSA